MWLAGLYKRELETLWREQAVAHWEEPAERWYRIGWIPGHHFTVSRGLDDEKASATVSEVFGFFQASFLKALSAWQIADVSGALERIERGKSQRGDFGLAQLDEIARYCHAEVAMLQTLMERLREAFHRAGFLPARWEGAGQAAGALMRAQGVKRHHRPDASLPTPRLRRAILRAYFGGRIELHQAGEHDEATSYDVNSAYPSEATRLPALGGEWRRADRYDETAEWALWRCSWRCPWTPETPIMPFPYRTGKRIVYPEAGSGYYWAGEVRAAKALWGDAVQAGPGWTYTPPSDERPFAFINDLYTWRRELKASGDAAEKAIKLALNSLYGKLAQGVGWDGEPPPLRSYVWAGLITSGTRARMLSLARGAPDAVVWIATDGVAFTRDPGYPEGDNLGELERLSWREMFIVRPGIYTAREAQSGGVERVIDKTRGHVAGDLDFAELRDHWREHGFGRPLSRRVRRFIGLGAALGRREEVRWQEWRHWRERDVRLGFYPLNQRPDLDDELGGLQGRRRVRLRPLEVADPARLSDAFQPKTPDMPAEDWRDEQADELEQPDPYPDVEL